MSTTGWTSSLRSTERVVDVDCFFGAWGPECHTASDAVECGTEHMPDRTPERLPDKMSEHMSDIMPEKMSERMAEKMPDRMPERMCDILGSAIAPCGLTRTHTHTRTYSGHLLLCRSLMAVDVVASEAEIFTRFSTWDRMSEYMPERRGDRMSNKLVRLGITRSKVLIFIWFHREPAGSTPPKHVVLVRQACGCVKFWKTAPLAGPCHWRQILESILDKKP